MEIEVGEYIRTKDGIRKIVEINDGKYKTIFGKYILDRSYIGSVSVAEKNILKHSFNIIDLIEVGDYVNGNKINCFKIFNNISGEQCLNINYIYTNSLIIPVKDIKSIVTKEQFESIKYEVIKWHTKKVIENVGL